LSDRLAGLHDHDSDLPPASYSFVRKTEREFWLDEDSGNRRVPESRPDSSRLIEDHEDGDQTCAACGTEIRWLYFVWHPRKGTYAVGRCCIRKVISALPADQHVAYRDAVSSIDREMRNATRRGQGKPPIVGRRERLRSHIETLEAVLKDTRVTSASWVYNGNLHRVARDVNWYLGELGRSKRHSGFQSALKSELWSLGHTGFARELVSV
jgi:hypothetical protein